MGKSLRVAILVEVLVLVLALVFLAGFVWLGLGRDLPLVNIAIVLAGILVVSCLLVVLWRRTLTREAMVRRFFVSPDWIYNHEIGYAPLSRMAPDGDVYGLVTFAADALARMSYGFEVADAPDSFEPRFVIDSSTFLYHLSGDDADEGVVIDEWEGMLLAVEHPNRGEFGYREVAPFANAGELARLLVAHGALEPAQGDGR